MENNSKGSKSFFTPRMIMRVLSLICIVFVFCPAFLVSCSGQEIEVGVMDAVGGMSVQGQSVSDPQPVLLLCLILPVVVLVVSLMKKLTAKVVGLISLACMAVDLVIWFMFKAGVEEMASKNYCSAEPTTWFQLNVVAMGALVILSILVVVNVLKIDGAQEASGQPTNGIYEEPNVVTAVPQESSGAMFCPQCGAKLGEGAEFCEQCGAKVE